MSQWYDLASTSNKLRQSYVKGFLDISGGGVLLRGGNSVDFYNSPADLSPVMKIKHDEIQIEHNGSTIAVSTEKLRHLVSISENIQDAIDDLRANGGGGGGGGSNTSGVFDVDVSINAGISVQSDASIGGTLTVNAGTEITTGNLEILNGYIIQSDP